MAEMIAQLDGPIYVERVALFDNKQRNRAEEGDHEGASAPGRETAGSRFVEVLAECPTHLEADARRRPRSG